MLGFQQEEQKRGKKKLPRTKKEVTNKRKWRMIGRNGKG